MVSIELDITFFIQAGLFLLLVYLLNILVYRPVFRVMEERRKRVADFESDAASAERKIEERIAEYRAGINEAKEKGNAIRAELKKEGIDREGEILGAAHEGARKSIEEARKKIEKETDAALKVLRGMTEEMGRDIAQKVLGRTR